MGGPKASGIGWWSFEKVEHVLGRLLKVGLAGEGGKGNGFRKEVNLEDVTLGHGVGEIAFPTPVVFKGRADVPANLAVGAEWSAGVGGGMGNDLGAGRGERSSIEVELAKERGVGREGRVDSRGAEQVESQRRLGEKAVPFG